MEDFDRRDSAEKLRTSLPGTNHHILGYIQLLFWLFFRPSAWKSHIARIDSSLRPDFALSDLNAEQLHNHALRRLLVQTFIIGPFLTGALSGILLALVRIPGDVLLISLLFTIVNSLALGILLGVAVGVAVGTVGGLVSGGINGIIIAIAIAHAGPAVELDTISLLTAVGNNLTLTALFAGLNNIAIGVTASFLFTLANDRTDYIAPRRSLEIGAVVLGFVTNVFTLGLAFLTAIAIAGGVLFDLTYIVVYSVAIGGAVGLRTQQWRRCVAAGMGAGLLRTIDSLVGQSIGSNGLPGALAGLTMSAVTTGLLYASFLALPHAIATRVAGTRAGAIAGVIGISGISLAENYLVVAAAGTQHTFLSVIAPITLLGMLVGVTQAWWRPLLLYPFCAAGNLVLYQIDRRRPQAQSSYLRWHSAFWDEHQWLPLVGLDEYLVLVAERNPPTGQIAIDELATTAQRWAVQRAQIELDARLLERCDDVYALAQSHRTLAAGDLTGPASALLRSFSRISQDVQAAISQTSESAYSQRLALSAVEDRLDGLLRELVRSNELYALRFRSIAMQWRTIIAAHVRALVEAVEQRQEIDSPYVIAVPLTEQQDIFVGRTDVSRRIERLVLDQLHPPLLLYGQRRMGKTSLLNNLGRLLPSTFLPLFVDLMGPVSLANDHAGFLYGIARAMIASADQRRNVTLPPLDYQTLIDNPFIRFDEWLDAVEQVMRRYGRETALLLLDEFEVLEQVLTEGRLSEMAVLGTLRHLIQHRTRFKVILAGSHTVGEIRHLASYLINVQLIHIGYLNEAEARQLIEHPVKDFALRYTLDAVQRVLDVTRCHPFLVQLLCREIVAVKNLQPPTIRRLAHPEDVEQAIPQALSTGRLFFEDIEVNQVDGVSRAALRFVASQGEGTTVSQTALQHHFPDMLEQTLALLMHREILEPHNGGYRFQVELIRRWFTGANQRVVERLGGDQ